MGSQTTVYGRGIATGCNLSAGVGVDVGVCRDVYERGAEGMLKYIDMEVD